LFGLVVRVSLCSHPLTLLPPSLLGLYPVLSIRFAGDPKQIVYERLTQEQIDEKVFLSDLIESEVLPVYESCQRKLALVYSSVLQWNMKARFESGIHFDEAAFYELLYKFITHSVRKWRLGDVPLCPPGLWKEIDVELGRVFRGKTLLPPRVLY